MTDRELLELAAKAAGIALNKNGMAINPIRKWNPLTDDGDALRLAVKLGILDMHKELNALVQEEQRHHDRHSATRRAIVRAAAEIGRKI
jgi:hypothetical protein